MKTRIAALAGALALTLLMSTVWGKGKPDKQLQQSAVLSAAFLLEIPDVPQYPPIVSALGSCPTGSTPFTGQFEGLTTVGDYVQEYTIVGLESGDSFTVNMKITVQAGNSFDFDFDTSEDRFVDGFVHKILVKAGSAIFLYDYAPIDTFPDVPEPPAVPVLAGC